VIVNFFTLKSAESFAHVLEIFCRENNSETKLFEFQIPAGEAEDETYPVSYYARFSVKQFTGLRCKMNRRAAESLTLRSTERFFFRFRYVLVSDSRDLLHWEQKDDVLFPDETGTMFSGSGIVNDRKMLGLPEDALVFSIRQPEIIINGAQGNSLPSAMAYSTDGGETLHKIDKSVLPTVCKENRDPKVFWHEKSGAYIMTL